MEPILINIGIVILILVWLEVTYLLPLTAASVVAIIYISKIGLAGYFIIWSESSALSTVSIVFVMVALVVDIALWIIGKRSGKKLELQK
ncbi:MAG TPA: hypothetical protein ENH26_01190 [Candidatus Wolfebacteria bacterium]|nr:hypothetical protein [Candidatus Wolfebacteria bacterium]